MRTFRAASLILLPGLLLAAQARADQRLDPRVFPTSQAIDLKIDADQPAYSGSVRIELQVREAVSSFTLHAEGQEFQRFSLSGDPGEVRAEATRGADGLVSVATAAPLAPGAYRLEIDFSAVFNTRAVGLYRTQQDGRGYLFTQFEPTDARKAFPCWDEPSFKIPYQVTLRVPEQHVAVTNTPLERESVQDGWRTLVFRATRPLPSYLLAIASGPLESVPIAGMSIPGRVYTVKGQSRLAALAVEMTPPILAALEKFFDRPYPYEKLDLIAVPEYWPGAMENPGAVTFKDDLLLPDPKLATVEEKRALASVTAHELAHMWFGDLVTMAWWDDMWLNESFATWMAAKITRDLYPQYKGDLADRRAVQGLMAADARPSTKPVRKPVENTADVFEDLGLQYGKGQKVLGMLEQWMGPEAFRKGVLDYLGRHAWGNARAADLWAALRRASGMNVDPVLSAYLDQTGLPLVTASVEAGGVVRLSQQRFLNAGVLADARTWTLPVRLRVSRGGKVETRTVLLDGPAARVEFGGEVDWLLPDADAIGYYRWSLPRPMMSRMAREAKDTLTAPERIAYLGNAAALLDQGTLSGGDYLEVLNAFSGDPEPEVVSTMVSGLGKVEAAFVPDELKDEFAGFLRVTLGPLLERFGVDRRPGEEDAVSLFRPRLVAWLGHEARDPAVQKRARELSRAYMDKPETVDPALADVVLGIAARNGDQTLFEAYRKGFEAARVPADRGRYLEAMGAFTDARIREQALEYALKGPLRPNEILAVPGGIAAESEADHDLMLGWLMAHFDEVKNRIPPQFVAFLPFLAGGCSTERLETARVFFMDPARRVEGTEVTLGKIADQVQDCARLRQREGPAVAAYLRSIAARETTGASGGGSARH